MLPSFPSDRYALASQVSFHGYHPEEAIITLEPKAGESYVRLDELEEVLKKEGENITLVILDGMNYYSGQTFNMQRVTELGHNQGCLVGFDLAHAVGNIELSLHNWGVDFAVWCSYKYLNGGPGCVAGCFVHDKYANACDLPRFAGWWGNNKKTRFLMGPKFEPIYGAEGWQVSNPPIFSLAAFRSSLELFHEVGMQALRRKSILLTGYLEYLLNERCEDRVSIFTPRNPDQRGCQLSLSIARGGRAVFESLREIGVVCDWREPDVIRVAPVPFYNTFSEVYEFVDCLEKALE